MVAGPVRLGIGAPVSGGDKVGFRPPIIAVGKRRTGGQDSSAFVAYPVLLGDEKGSLVGAVDTPFNMSDRNTRSGSGQSPPRRTTRLSAMASSPVGTAARSGLSFGERSRRLGVSLQVKRPSSGGEEGRRRIVGADASRRLHRVGRLHPLVRHKAAAFALQSRLVVLLEGRRRGVRVESSFAQRLPQI
jgi:hypothetical protein